MAEKFPRAVQDVEAESARIDAVRAASLKSGDGDGTSGGMEVRVARLEVDVDYIKRDVADIKADMRGVKTDITGIKIDLARIDERLKSMPTKWFVVTSVTAIIGLFTALSIFGDKVRAVFGLG